MSDKLVTLESVANNIHEHERLCGMRISIIMWIAVPLMTLFLIVLGYLSNQILINTNRLATIEEALITHGITLPGNR